MTGARSCWLASLAMVVSCGVRSGGDDAGPPGDAGRDAYADAGAPAGDGGPCTIIDADRDGVRSVACGGADCDDSSRDVHPGAAETCNAIDDDCDGSVDEAEASACAVPNAIARCTSGGCVVTSCTAPFLDCDGLGVNGCEADPGRSHDHCGACGDACAATEACVGGTCQAQALVQVSGGLGHTCGLRGGGGVVCWGANGDGQLGDGTTIAHPLPIDVPGISDAIHVAAGGAYSCAVRATGEVLCWGDNSRGQLGDGTTRGHSTPAPVAGISDAVEVRAVSSGTRESTTCARHRDGRVSCWGFNGAGQCGDGTTSSPRTSPVSVIGVAGATAIGVNEQIGCALVAGGEVWCWGYGGASGSALTARAMPALSGASALSISRPRTGVGPASALQGGRLYEWEHAGSTPALAPGSPSDVVQYAYGDDFTSEGLYRCALRSTGVVSCWGSNFRGSCGIGTFAPRVASPTPVVGLSGTVLAVAAGQGGQTCALRAGADLLCWGANIAGQVGDGTETDRASPVAVTLP